MLLTHSMNALRPAGGGAGSHPRVPFASSEDGVDLHFFFVRERLFER